MSSTFHRNSPTYAKGIGELDPYTGAPDAHSDKHAVHTPLALLRQGNWVAVRTDRLYNRVSYR